jgi:hypothetical protein
VHVPLLLAPSCAKGNAMLHICSLCFSSPPAQIANGNGDMRWALEACARAVKLAVWQAEEAEADRLQQQAVEEEGGAAAAAEAAGTSAAAAAAADAGRPLVSIRQMSVALCEMEGEPPLLSPSAMPALLAGLDVPPCGLPSPFAPMNPGFLALQAAPDLGACM